MVTNYVYPLFHTSYFFPPKFYHLIHFILLRYYSYLLVPSSYTYTYSVTLQHIVVFKARFYPVGDKGGNTWWRLLPWPMGGYDSPVAYQPTFPVPSGINWVNSSRLLCVYKVCLWSVVSNWDYRSSM